MAHLLVDTGFFVALYRRRDALHAPAVAFLQANQAQLMTVAPVVTETCYFLDAAGKIAFLEWISSAAVKIADIPVDGYPSVAATLWKYRDLDIDFTDAALVWLAEIVGAFQILTVDTRDFAAFRLKRRKRFDLVAWYD
ncbi:MAG TPA: PIN domain-containing protein [Burkholderiales bacterium]|nr:PIN domain-containing protein [Burkholderiales bacterium]